MLSKFVDDLKKQHKEQEQKRVGDIYAECVNLGCDQTFLQSFDTRIWLYPIEQTKAFLERLQNGKYKSDTQKHLNQWEIYLRVILEKRPNHEKANEWKKALELLR